MTADPIPGRSGAAVAGRAVEVYRRTAGGTWALGTGVLLDGGLVLTAAHVVVGPAPEDASGTAGPPDAGKGTGDEQPAGISVRVPGDHGGPWTCALLWHRYDRPAGTGLDAALLRVTDSRFRPPSGLPRLRWGRFISRTGTRRVEGVGFPAGMDLRTGGRLAFRDTAQFTGEITPGSRVKAGRHAITVHTPVPPVPPSAAARAGRADSRWRGMSGSGVMCEGLLVAVVVVDPGDPAGGALTAVPVEAVLADPVASRLLGRIRAENVELVNVVSPPPSLSRTPAGLLRAEATPVGCHGRDDMIGELMRWCAEPARFALRLLTAPGGEGKSRLGRELVERLTGLGWAAGFLDEQCPDGLLPPLVHLSEPLLLVLDYAETRTAQLRSCLAALGSDRHGENHVRLLLLARSAGEWWTRARVLDRALRELPPGSIRGLPPLAPDIASRQEVFTRAAEALAPALSALSGAADTSPGDKGVQLAPIQPPGLAGPRYSSALSLHMAALSALLRSSGPASGHLAQNRAGHEEETLLLHEEHYWVRTAAAHGIAHLHPATLRQLMAVATLRRPEDPARARALLGTLECLRGAGAGTVLGAATWLHELHGAPDAYWSGLRPDPLGEYLVGATLEDFPELLDEIGRSLSREQASHALRVLSRAAVPFPRLGQRVATWVAERPRPLAFAVMELMTQEPEGILGACLDGVLDNAAASGTPGAELAAELLDAVPRHTHVLAERAVRMAELSSVRFRSLSGAADRKRHAGALLALAYRLAATGRHEKALRAAEQAVLLQGASLEGAWDGEAFDGDELTETLLAYAARLDELGRSAEAARIASRLLALTDAATGTEGTVHTEGGVRADSAPGQGGPLGPAPTGTNTHADRQSRIVHHLAWWSHRAGHQEEALRWGSLAVELRRPPAGGQERQLGELAGSLVNQALYLQAARAPRAALTALSEALSLLRHLTEQTPDAYRSRLGRALHNAGRLHSALGEPGQALARAREAVSVHRDLAGPGTPPARSADLAAVLTGLATRLMDVGAYDEAEAALTESAALRRALADDGAPTALGGLATALTDLAALLLRPGTLDEAEPAARARELTAEAVRVLVKARACGWSPPGAMSARVLGHRGLALARTHPALAADPLRQAVAEARRSGAHDFAERYDIALRGLPSSPGPEPAASCPPAVADERDMRPDPPGDPSDTL
ncbi:trypsin-like peptidase domain-containing protein [Streptomyces cyaneofuscatus]|uniref:trypsin-like peptidase domain-containing protein n=1 Tax=Streptomyces cyaneofuscatus TaxID=66883 RepID=UPI0036DDA3FD